MIDKIVCTVVTKSHLAFARALAHSLNQFEPGIPLYVLLVDQVDDYFDPNQEPFKIIYLENLVDQKTVQNMCFYYTPFELCCAMRGMLHEFIYENNLANSWLFLDSDILVFNSLQEIFQKLETTSILLNPHTTEPIAQPYVNPLEISILISGNYNAGFLGLRRTEETRKFISWFKDRLNYYSFSRRGSNLQRHLFVDQLWLNLVPQFFQDVDFLIHPGANAGYWNLITRTITKQGDTYFVDAQPLLFVHFSGWNIAQPEKLSKHCPFEVNLDYWTEWTKHYEELLLKYGHQVCQQFPYTFSTFTDNRLITLEMRDAFYNQLAQSELNLESPFSQSEFFSKLGLQPKNSILQRVLRKIASACNRLASKL
jgi:hypothetical protein